MGGDRGALLFGKCFVALVGGQGCLFGCVCLSGAVGRHDCLGGICYDAGVSCVSGE